MIAQAAKDRSPWSPWSPWSPRSPRWLPAVAPPALLLFNNSVRTAKKTQLFTITKISLLTLFKEIIAVYTENHTKQESADL
jgi:hypothetical protein